MQVTTQEKLVKMRRKTLVKKIVKTQKTGVGTKKLVKMRRKTSGEKSCQNASVGTRQFDKRKTALV